MLTNNTELIKKQFLQAVEDAINETSVTGVAELQSNSPVLSGTLRRSITSKNDINGNKYKITFGSAIDYSIYTEFRNKSKGWMRRTMNGLSSEAKSILEKHLRKVGK